MNNGKQILFTGILLMLFGIIGSGLVGTTYVGTLDKIADNERKAMLRSLNQILPGTEYDNNLINDTLEINADPLLGLKHPSIIYLARKQGIVTTLIFSPVAPDGYSGMIKLLVGIHSDGRVAGVRVVSHKETPGLGDYVETDRSDWVLEFNDKTLQHPDTASWKVKRDGGEFDQFTGATITPRAVVKAVHQTLIYFEQNKTRLLGKPQT
ncbi:MAG: electron transport complex subunit RsxG [Gammaproteobacteria bacterium]|nr:electron transport complex subunit RsxG [Gammaproteobacteria bacterium]